MFKREIEMFVLDIIIAILKIEDTSSRYNNVEDLLYNYNDWDSVIREFEIIGEASKHLIRNKLLAKEYQKIVDFRNKITHEYFGIEPVEIWNIIQNNLEEFKNSIDSIFNNTEKDLKGELIDSFIEDNLHLDFIVKYLKDQK